MPKFTIDHQSSHAPEEAYRKIKEFLSNDQDIRRFDPKLQCLFNDGSKSAALMGAQFKADMAVAAAGAGSKVSVTVDLPLMLTPFKGKVQETLQRKLAKYLG
ncbi:MAG: polyhydroxyalkanoic acid system family protein [Bdellovibrio sp.]|uniref:polyhydroxyalkanoic acid system family protein n=1 Tax=Bdellovibrio sp. TaxID=28201 RepID=UPI0039E2576C|nr:polyhydroxyalkanoic acid system family protein [Bdellovibrio sp.]